MKIWCLTSLIPRNFDPDYMTPEQYDYFMNKLRGCEKYAFTELCIVSHDVNFEFQVSREDIGVFRYIMAVSHLSFIWLLAV